MGDLGIELDDQQFSAFDGRCDVLLALTGQKYTPKFAELDRIFDMLRPT